MANSRLIAGAAKREIIAETLPPPLEFSECNPCIARQPDHGDLWELYRGLDGGSKIAMTRKQPIPKPGAATFSSR